jgi:alpha-L-fucosidase
VINKKTAYVLWALSFIFSVHGAEAPIGQDGAGATANAEVAEVLNPADALGRRMAWWEEARFGMMLCWGPYSVLEGEYKGVRQKHAYAEQIQRVLKISPDDYRKDAAEKLSPEGFDAENWVIRAKAAGAKFIVITAKFHDGFAIYHSDYCDFDIADTSGWTRDPLMELSEACRKHGLKLGVYYSQSQDWHDCFDPSGSWDAPGNPAMAREWWNPKKFDAADANLKQFEEYVKRKGVPQVIELIERYGVELLWFDTPAVYPREFAKMFADAVRKAKPDMIMNARIGFGHGDYGGSPDSPVVFPYRNTRYWEAIQSTTHSWGYNKFAEEERKSNEYLLRMLASVVSKGGTMMVNVSPKADSSLVDGDLNTLDAFSDWSRDHIESIRGANRSPLPTQNWGVVTSRDNELFLHVFNWPENGKLRVGGIRTPVESVELMAGNRSLAFEQNADEVLVIDVPAQASHPINSVIRVRCSAPPEGGTNRLVEPERDNRFHIADTPLLNGKLRQTNGVGRRAYVEEWNDPSENVVWKIRATEKAAYSVHIIYEPPKGMTVGDEYRISFGDQQLEGVVNSKGTGPVEYVDREAALMRMNDRGAMVIDSLGTILLKPGAYDMTLRSAGSIKNKELFRPRAIILVPEEL